MAIGFKLMGTIRYWGLIALIIAIVDMLPLIGSGIVFIPWAIILLVTGKGLSALYLMIIYIITFVARQILEPILVGKSVGLKPIYTLAISIISILLFGPIGAIVGGIISVIISAYLEMKREMEREKSKDINDHDKGYR